MNYCCEYVFFSFGIALCPFALLCSTHAHTQLTRFSQPFEINEIRKKNKNSNNKNNNKKIVLFSLDNQPPTFHCSLSPQYPLATLLFRFLHLIYNSFFSLLIFFLEFGFMLSLAMLVDFFLLVSFFGAFCRDASSCIFIFIALVLVLIINYTFCSNSPIFFSIPEWKE